MFIKTYWQFGFIGFKAKKIQCHGQLQESMLSPAGECWGWTWCKKWIASYDLLRDTSIYSQQLRGTRKIVQDEEQIKES